MSLSHKLVALCALSAALPFLLLSLIVLNTGVSESRAANLDGLRADARLVAGLYEKRLEAVRAAAQQFAVDVANKALVSSDNQRTEAGAAMARLQDMLP